MNFQEYQEGALRTAPINRKDWLDDDREGFTSSCDLDHASIGIGTEAGELLDINKRFKYYGKGIDWLHVIEEAGDVLWYLALVARAANTTLEDIAERNLGKLKARYPGKYSNEAALNRDLEKEREALEEEKASRDDANEFACNLIAYCVREKQGQPMQFLQPHAGKTYSVYVCEQPPVT